MISTSANMTIPTDAQVDVALSATIAELVQIRDDLRFLAQPSMSGAEFALQLDAIIQKAQARI